MSGKEKGREGTYIAGIYHDKLGISPGIASFYLRLRRRVPTPFVERVSNALGGTYQQRAGDLTVPYAARNISNLPFACSNLSAGKATL